MKKICMIPVFCILALCFIVIAPKTSHAADFSASFDKVPSSVTHDQSFITILNITTPDDRYDGLLYIYDFSEGLRFRMASEGKGSSWQIQPVIFSPHIFTALYKVAGDVTDHIVASYHILYHSPNGGSRSIRQTIEIPVVHEPGPWTIVSDATCTTPGTKTTNCTYCMVEMTEEIPATGGVLSTTGHTAGEWIVTTAPTNKTAGTQVLNCTQCGVSLETKTVPILREIWPSNTACSLGLRFRDEAPSLTGKWYMYTPVDLSQAGVQTFPLIASNAYIIGSVSVTVEDGAATAAYTLHTKKIKVKEEFLTFFPDLASVKDVEPEKWTEPRFAFGKPVLLEEQLHGAASTLMFLRLVIDYDIYADGVVRYYESAYKQK